MSDKLTRVIELRKQIEEHYALIADLNAKIAVLESETGPTEELLLG